MSEPAREACLPDVTTLPGPPVVGQWYRVPAVHVPTTGCWVPVLGPAHTDPKLPGGEQEHYHLDLRFCEVHIVRSWDPFLILATDEEVLRAGLLFVLSAAPPPPELQPMPCLREQLVHWARNLRASTEALVPPQACLTERCPHRGIERAAMAESLEDGVRVLVCPGHGLRFCADTGLVRRRPAEATP